MCRNVPAAGSLVRPLDFLTREVISAEAIRLRRSRMFRVSGGTAGHLVGNNQACAGFALVISWVQTDSRAVLAKQKKVLRLQLETAEKQMHSPSSHGVRHLSSLTMRSLKAHLQRMPEERRRLRDRVAVQAVCSLAAGPRPRADGRAAQLLRPCQRSVVP